MTLPGYACTDYGHRVYEFNIGNSSNSHNNCCGQSQCNSIFPWAGGNFGKAVGTGVAITAAISILDRLFSGPQQKFDGWFSSAGNWCNGLSFGNWGGGFDFGMGNWFGGFDQVMANSPLGWAFAGIEKTRQETEEYKEKAEKYKTVINGALEATDLKDKSKNIMSQFYKDLVNKCEAIKTANTSITDAELQTRIENLLTASEHDSNLTTYLTSDKKEDLTVCEIGKEQETFSKIGKGYVELLDANTDGKVEVTEFATYEAQVAKGTSEYEAAKEAAITMFALIDENNDDCLDAAELAAYNHLMTTYKDAEGTSTAEDLTKEEVEAWQEDTTKMVEKGEENGTLISEFQAKHKKLVDEYRQVGI